jgi:hypothetical protein
VQAGDIIDIDFEIADADNFAKDSALYLPAGQVKVSWPVK